MDPDSIVTVTLLNTHPSKYGYAIFRNSKLFNSWTGSIVIHSSAITKIKGISTALGVRRISMFMYQAHPPP